MALRAVPNWSGPVLQRFAQGSKFRPSIGDTCCRLLSTKLELEKEANFYYSRNTVFSYPRLSSGDNEMIYSSLSHVMQRTTTGHRAKHCMHQIMQHPCRQTFACRTITTGMTNLHLGRCSYDEKKHGQKMSHSSVSTAALSMHKKNLRKSDNGEHADEKSDIRIEKCPKMELARNLPLTIREASNDLVFTMASQGHNDACCEMLRRHIMVNDNITYEAAQEKLQEIRLANIGGQKAGAYIHVGVIGLAVTAGFLSFLLVFDINTVLYFNEHYVTMDVPAPDELDTTLEVGAWSWNWMEPPLGQISFFLLCMQFAKGECEFLGIDPLHDWYRNRRAEKLVKKYPMYNSTVLRAFSLSERYFRR